MIIQKNNLFIVILLLFFNVCVHAKDTNESKLEIKAYSFEIKIGEPLILEIRVIYYTPNINPKSGNILTSGKIDTLDILVTKKGQEELKHEVLPVSLSNNSSNGLEYTGSSIVFYDHNTDSLLFKETGVYTCRLESAMDKLESNTIEINVKPASEQEQKALSILNEGFDLLILVYPDSDVDIKKESPGTMGRFKQVVEKCPDTMLAKMVAARLGIEQAEELEDKYSDGEKFINQYSKGKITEPLVESATRYLNLAYQLPDIFPIREASLNKLAVTELINGNAQKVLSLFDELSVKYPHGKYGKQALSDKKDIQEFIEGHPDLFTVEKDPLDVNKSMGVALPIAGIMIVVIVIAGLFIFSRKKKLNKTE